MSYLVKAFWMIDEDDVNQLKEILELIPGYIESFNFHPHMSEFRKLKALSLIYSSNKLEATIPVGASQADTYSILSELLSSSDSDVSDIEDLKNESWDSDGEPGSQFRRQLYHHCVAYQYLCEKGHDGKCLYEAPLTVDIVLKAHQLLMENSTSHGKAVAAGQFRDHAVHADTYVYMRHEEVPNEVGRIVEAFNLSVANKEDPVKIAGNLFYDLITAHPFQDGNGRLCRLMVAFAFFATGTPFPVPVTTGHTKSRNHYMNSILKARRIGNDRRLLYTLFANSLELSWSNAIDYCK